MVVPNNYWFSYQNDHFGVFLGVPPFKEETPKSPEPSATCKCDSDRLWISTPSSLPLAPKTHHLSEVLPLQTPILRYHSSFKSKFVGSKIFL